MMISLTCNPIRFSSQMKYHIKKSGFWLKKSFSWHAFFRACNPIQISSHSWITWQKRVQTLVKKSGSWLREMVATNGCCFSCLVSDHVKTFHIVDGLEGEQRGGAWAPGGEEVWGMCAVLGEEPKEERPFSWCDSLAHFYPTFLAPLWLVCLWLFLFFPCSCLSDLTLSSVSSVWLWEQHTPVKEVSLLTTWGRREVCLSCLCCSCGWLSPRCQTDFDTALSVFAVRLWLP